MKNKELFEKNCFIRWYDQREWFRKI